MFIKPPEISDYSNSNDYFIARDNWFMEMGHQVDPWWVPIVVIGFWLGIAYSLANSIIATTL